MRLARIVSGVGRTFIGAGVLLLLFVAYQLWGTGLHEARAQRRLTREFEQALATTTTTTSTSTTTTLGEPAPTTTTTVVPLPAPKVGDAVAVIEIPDIGVERTVVEGVSVADLKKGPGHYPGTPLPGQVGNAAIAGHRTTYGAPFFRLNELEKGDEILVRTLQGEFTYLVEELKVVKPTQVDVLDPTMDARLTLTTCNPRYSARERLIVTALLAEESEPAPPTLRSTTERTELPAEPDEPDEDEAPAVLDDPAGLSGDPTARWPALWWGLAAAAVGFVIWGLSKRWRRWWSYVLGAPVFLVVLFVFFENVARLLPANV